MKELNIDLWNRKEHYQHFRKLTDPYFAVTVPLDVTQAYKFAKTDNCSFFAKYLHDCMSALNSVENLKYRIIDNKVVIYDTIHASATLIRQDKTFGFSWIEYNNDLRIFERNINSEKERMQYSTDLYPPINGLDCIHCSAMPWLKFSGHKEPNSGVLDSVPKLAFSKVENKNGELVMNVAISVNHALVDGYHVSLFVDQFQNNLNN